MDAAQAMFSQSQAFQTEKNKKEKARFVLVFLIFKKAKCIKTGLNFKI